MFHFLKALLFSSILCAANTNQSITDVTINCPGLGLSFQVPAGFRALDSAQLNALSQRGDKAVKESFNNETLKGWQPGCLNHQDSLKRTILMNTYSVAEAIAGDGSAEQFMTKTFADANRFIVQRFKDRANIEVDAQKAVLQSELTIAGMKVRKNAFTFIRESRLLFFARNYFFQKNGRLYLLSFTGSPKASDNEAIVRAIEQAKAL